MCLWLCPDADAAEDFAAELESVRRALIIDFDDRIAESGNVISKDRQADLAQLQQTLISRCGMRVTRRNASDNEMVILKWINQTRSAQEIDQYVVVYLRGLLSVHQDELRIGASDGLPNDSVALASTLRSFQNHSARANVLVVLEDESSPPSQNLETILRQTLQRANVKQPQLALLVLPHFAAASGNARATRCFAESLGWSGATLTTSGAGDIGLSITKLCDLLSDRLPVKDRLAVALSDVTRPFYLPIAPFRISELMECLARQLSTQLIREGVQRVGLLPFVIETSQPSPAGIPGEDCGTLSRICREKLLGYLQSKSLSKFEVARDEEILKALYECQIVPSSMMSDVPHAHFPKLEDQIQGKDEELSTALVWVRMKLEGSTRMTFRVGLYSQKPHKFESIRETAVLTPQDAPAVGGSGGTIFKSIQTTSSVSAPMVQSINLHSPKGRQQNEEAVEKQRLVVHPLSDEHFQYRISLLVNDELQPVQFTTDKSVAYTVLKPRDRIVIRVENHSLNPVFMRLTVDGKNTLPDRDDESGHMVPQKFVDWKMARAWYLEPAPQSNQHRVYHIRGFLSQIAGDDRRDQSQAQGSSAPRFDVADVDLFEVGQPKYIEELPRGFRDQAGMLTVGFYQPVTQPIAQGDGQFLPIIKGPREKQTIQIFQEPQKPADVPLAYYSLRYGYAPSVTASSSPN